MLDVPSTEAIVPSSEESVDELDDDEVEEEEDAKTPPASEDDELDRLESLRAEIEEDELEIGLRVRLIEVEDPVGSGLRFIHKKQVESY